MLSDPITCNDFKVASIDVYGYFLSSWYNGKSMAKFHTRLRHWPCTQLCWSPSPFSCMSQNKISFHWRRRREGGGIFQTISFFIFFLNKKILESINDRVFEAEKTFKNDLFQPHHLAFGGGKRLEHLNAVEREDWTWNRNLRLGAPGWRSH